MAYLPVTGGRKKVFLSSTTWTVPIGVTEITVSMCGGGGGGRATPTGGGGAGAGSMINTPHSVTPNATLTITVGNGGAGGVTTGGVPEQYGATGGSSSIVQSAVTILEATGGLGAGQDATVPWAEVKVDGVSAGCNDIPPGAANAPGHALMFFTGAAPATVLHGTDGVNAASYGCYGSGGRGNTGGGGGTAGMPGIVIIEY
jgi:hypothetical protein